MAASRKNAGSGRPRKERIQKILARAGYGSRRACEKLITDRRVAVSGRAICELGAKADPREETITVDGEPVRLPGSVYLLYHKPRGVTTTMSDPRAELTIAEAAGLGSRPGDRDAGVKPVGRLDRDTSGAIILTNDGDFANRVMHPSYGVEKIYNAEVKGKMTPEAVKKLKDGLYFEGAKAAATGVHVDYSGAKKSRLTIRVVEGRKHVVRRMLYRVGFPVRRLTRIGIGAVALGRLPEGAARALSAEEIAVFQNIEKKSAPRRRVKRIKRVKRTGGVGRAGHAASAGRSRGARDRKAGRPKKI